MIGRSVGNREQIGFYRDRGRHHRERLAMTFGLTSINVRASEIL